jgi:ankyrin repeat protein
MADHVDTETAGFETAFKLFHGYCKKGQLQEAQVLLNRCLQDNDSMLVRVNNEVRLLCLCLCLCFICRLTFTVSPSLQQMETVLHIGIKQAYPMEIIEWLFSLDRSLANSSDRNGKTALHVAVECRRCDVIKLFLHNHEDHIIEVDANAVTKVGNR